MVTDYMYYLSAYAQEDSRAKATDRGEWRPPSSESQLAAQALGLSDWRAGREPRSRAQLIHDVRNLTLSDDVVRTSDLGEAAAAMKRAAEAGTSTTVSGVDGFTPAPKTDQALGGRVEEIAVALASIEVLDKPRAGMPLGGGILEVTTRVPIDAAVREFLVGGKRLKLVTE